MRCLCNSRFASSRPTVSRTVTSGFSGRARVMSSLTGWRRSVAKRTSRWVRMPSSRPLPVSTTGRPEKW